MATPAHDLERRKLTERANRPRESLSLIELELELKTKRRSAAGIEPIGQLADFTRPINKRHRSVSTLIGEQASK